MRQAVNGAEEELVTLQKKKKNTRCISSRSLNGIHQSY